MKPNYVRPFFLLCLPAILLLVLIYYVQQVRGQVYAVRHGVNAPIAVSADGRFVASFDGNLELLDTSTGIVTRLGDTAFGGTLLFAPDNETLLVGGHTENLSEFGYRAPVQLWDAPTRTLKATIADVTGPAVALSPDGKTLATGDTFGVQLWTFPTGKKIALMKGNYGNPKTINFSANGALLGASNGVYDVKTRKLLWSPDVPRNLLSFDTISGALSPDGKTFALGSQNGKVAFFDGATGAFLRAGIVPNDTSQFSSNPDDDCRFVAFSSDSQLLASGGWHGVSIWNASDGSIRKRLTGTGICVFSQDGRYLYTRGRDLMMEKMRQK
jgi:WD40 repeat protein